MTRQKQQQLEKSESSTLQRPSFYSHQLYYSTTEEKYRKRRKIIQKYEEKIRKKEEKRRKKEEKRKEKTDKALSI